MLLSVNDLRVAFRLGTRQRGAAAQLQMLHQRLAKLVAHGQHRIERAHRILEHAGDVLAAQPAQLGR